MWILQIRAEYDLRCETSLNIPPQYSISGPLVSCTFLGWFLLVCCRPAAPLMIYQLFVVGVRVWDNGLWSRVWTLPGLIAPDTPTLAALHVASHLYQVMFVLHSLISNCWIYLLSFVNCQVQIQPDYRISLRKWRSFFLIKFLFVHFNVKCTVIVRFKEKRQHEHSVTGLEARPAYWIPYQMFL